MTNLVECDHLLAETASVQTTPRLSRYDLHTAMPVATERRGRREGGREGGRERGKDGGWKEGWREGWKERRREGGRESVRLINYTLSVNKSS